jgi:hypothetical protein
MTAVTLRRALRWSRAATRAARWPVAVRGVGFVALSLAALVAPPVASAQDRPAGESGVELLDSIVVYDGSEPLVAPEDPDAARTPWGPGERLEYNVKLGVFSVGDGHMTLSAMDTVRGNPVYHATMGIQGGVPFARVDDETHSWFDTRTLQSWRFVQDIDEVNYESFRHYEMFPDRRTWERADNDESGPLGSALPLDDISFVYFIRTLPLEVGKTYTLSRYFKEDGNPVTIQVLRKDRREVPAGEFETIVVKPIIRTDGLFGEGGNAEIHFSDDERRLLVYLRSEIPVVGSITLHLEDVQEGLPLNPAARAAALARRGGDTEPSQPGG